MGKFSGYLENQQLAEAHKSFYESSRHLSKEKRGLRDGNRLVDTTIGLVNIIREYFSVKAKISEFLRLCPPSQIVIKLIDTDDTLLRLDIILKEFKKTLNHNPTENLKKRRHDSNEFEISHTNTSTPETMPPPKRLKKSLSSPFLTFSANKENVNKAIDRAAANRAELAYNSSSETSEKDEDGNEDEGTSSRTTTSPPSQLLKSNPEVSDRIRILEFRNQKFSSDLEAR